MQPVIVKFYSLNVICHNVLVKHKIVFWKLAKKKMFGTFMFSWQYHWCHFLLALNPVSVESLCVSLCHYVTFVRIKTNNWEVSEFKRKFSLKLRGLHIEFIVCEVRWYPSPAAVEWLPTVQLGFVAIWLYWSVKLNPRVLSWAEI